MRANDRANGRTGEFIRPRYMVWENVPGAFSSNNGEDFRIVLEELIKIVEPTCKVPPAPKGGWPYADAYMGDGWSLAYRLFDAQYWGVPQRRRRIHLVTDFRGECAGQVSFEREGLRGYFTEGGTPWEGTAGDAGNCVEADDCGRNGVVDSCVLDDQGGSQISVRTDGKSPTLRAEMHGNVPCVMEAAGFKAGQGVKARSIGWEEEKCPTLAAEAGGNSVPTECVKEQRLFENHSQDSRYKGPLDASPTIPSQLGTGGNNTPFVVEKISPVYCLQGNGIDRADTAGCNGKGVKENICYTLNTIDRPAVAFAMQALCYAEPYQKVTGPLMANSHSGQDAYSDMLVVEKERPIVFDKEVYNSGENADGAHYISEGGPAPTIRSTGQTASALKARDYKDATDLVCETDCLTPWDAQTRRVYHEGSVWPTLQARENSGQNQQAVCYRASCIRYIVRRLTPTECARLQGFADRWGDIDAKDDFTDDEYRFWLDVRNTHAAINGKAVKEYTKAQMLTWYNKLRTDSSEYKMWGNGIALPPALYCMQGIMDALEGNSNEKY